MPGGAGSTAKFATRVTDEMSVVTDAAQATTVWPGGGDPFSNRQWDMIQIHVPEAQAINSGSPSVVVGDIDTGLDYTHPDLAANVDFANSVSCVGGVPNTNPAAWDDDDDAGAFFELRIRVDPMTNDVALVVTDHAWPKDLPEARALWDSQVANLARVLGA